jgi:hypothetical protein
MFRRSVLFPSSGLTSALKMEIARFSQTLAPINQPTGDLTQKNITIGNVFDCLLTKLEEKR